jgi:predicted amidohydrolase YtcJ
LESGLDLIIEGNILTMTTQQPIADAVGIKDGKIVTVGTLKDVSKDKGEQTRQLDLKDKTILPGFIDSHMHPLITGITDAGVDLSGVRSIEDTLDCIKKGVDNTPPGKRVLCFLFQDKLLQENRYPTKDELNDISTQHPIIVFHNDLHFAMLNDMALKLIDLPEGLDGVVTDADNKPTGYIEDPAIMDVDAKITKNLTDSEILNAINASAQLALRSGITTLHMKESMNVIRIIIKNEADIPVRIKPLVYVYDISDTSIIDEIVSNENLRERACICLLGDGTFDGHTAATFEPYTDDPTTYGMLFYTDEELYRFTKKVHDANFQLSIHAISDRSIEQALCVYERVVKENPRDNHRHRFEHFEVPTKSQLKRVSKMGLTAGMQPMFIPVCAGLDLEGYRQFIGEDRVNRSNAYRMILDEDILVAGGSDSPVTAMSALKGIQACLTHPNKAQRIDLYEALQLFTINGAKIGFEEDIKGSIEPGKLADFAVLEQNPYHVSPDEIGDINIEMTIKGGDIVFKKEV